MALLLTVAGCDEDYTGPGGIAGGGGGSPASDFVGVWEHEIIIDLDGDDFSISTTTWFFDAVETCRRRIGTELASEGIPRFTDRTCTWEVEGQELVVTWIDDLSVSRYEYEFTGFDGDELMLGPTLFLRVE